MEKKWHRRFEDFARECGMREEVDYNQVEEWSRKDNEQSNNYWEIFLFPYIILPILIDK